MRLFPRLTRQAITQADSRSALPVDLVSRVSTTNPLRFSINTCAMKLSFDSLPRDFLNSRASGSVVGRCVSLRRSSP